MGRMRQRACPKLVAFVVVVVGWYLVLAQDSDDGVKFASKRRRPKGEFLAGTFILTQKSLDEAPYRYLRNQGLYIQPSANKLRT